MPLIREIGDVICFGEKVYVCLGSRMRSQQRLPRAVPVVLRGCVDSEVYAEFTAALEARLKGKGVMLRDIVSPMCLPITCLLRLFLLPCCCYHEWRSRRDFEHAFVSTVEEWAPRLGPRGSIRCHIVDEPPGSPIAGGAYVDAGGLMTMDAAAEDAIILASPYPPGCNLVFDLGLLAHGEEIELASVAVEAAPDAPLLPADDSFMADVEVRLSRLRGLLDRGVVTPDEHARARENILADL